MIASMPLAFATARQSYATCRRILAHAVEEDGAHAVRGEAFENVFRMAGLSDAGIGDEQNFFCAKLADNFADAFHGVDAKDEPRARLEIKRRGGLLHWRHGRLHGFG